MIEKLFKMDRDQTPGKESIPDQNINNPTNQF